MAILLLGHGADVNLEVKTLDVPFILFSRQWLSIYFRKTNEQETPLHYGKLLLLFACIARTLANYITIACISEQREVAQLLIDHGCDLSIKNNDDQTALQLADDSFVSTLRIKE